MSESSSIISLDISSIPIWKAGVHVVSQENLAGFQISAQQNLNDLSEEACAEIRIALGARFDGLSEWLSHGLAGANRSTSI